MVPGDLFDLISACEGKYAEAKRKGYAKSPDVIAAVAVLKLACATLATANDNLATKGLFGRAVATMRAHRAGRATRKAMHQPRRGNRASMGGKSSTQSMLNAA